jgi:hypothetical protein
MMASYLFRLLCLCLATFFVLHAAAGIVVAAFTPLVLRTLLAVSARRAARVLFALRLLPVTLAVFFVAAVCVPSYLLLEEDGGVEEVGARCLVLAVFSLGVWMLSIARSVRAAALSRQHSRDWERVGSLNTFNEAGHAVCVVDSDRPLLAVSGVFHSRLVVSRGVTGALSLEQLDAALRHEEVHRTERDNLRRLLVLLAPGLIPGWSGFQALERAWLRFTEWAADDEAAAGSLRVSVSLAEALVRIARMGGLPTLTPLHATFLADGSELSARVDRLLGPVLISSAPRREPVIAIAAMITVAAFLTAITLHAVNLSSVHSLLEYLIR